MNFKLDWHPAKLAATWPEGSAVLARDKDGDDYHFRLIRYFTKSEAIEGGEYVLLSEARPHMTLEAAKIVLKFHDAIHMDLEMGSHNWNNWRSSKFAKEHPNLLKTLTELRIEAMKFLPEDFIF